MKFWSWKSQPIKPCSSSELIEPKFIEYKSYHHTQYGISYTNLGPYGEPIPPHQDGLSHDSTSLEYGDEGFCLLGKHWDENELNNQVYEMFQLPYGEYESYFAYENLQPPYGGSNGVGGGSGSGNWVGEYETYFVGGWGEDMFSGGYDEECGPHEIDKVEGDLCWGEGGDSYCSYDGGTKMEYSCYDDSYWFGFWEDEGFHGYNDGRQEDEASVYGLKGLDEMRLCESIFGHWPCLKQGLA